MALIRSALDARRSEAGGRRCRKERTSGSSDKSSRRCVFSCCCVCRTHQVRSMNPAPPAFIPAQIGINGCLGERKSRAEGPREKFVLRVSVCSAAAETGNPVQDVQFELTSDAVPESSGHAHHEPTLGWLIRPSHAAFCPSAEVLTNESSSGLNSALRQQQRQT